MAVQSVTITGAPHDPEPDPDDPDLCRVQAYAHLLWDNRRLMHRATPHDPEQPRRMWHTRIAGDPATESGLDH